MLKQSSKWLQRCHTNAQYLRHNALKGAVSDSPCYQNQVSGMPVQFLAYLHVSSLCIKEKRLLLWAPTSKQLPDKDAKQHPLINLIDPNRESQRNMHLSSIPLYCLLLILKLQLSSTYPITGLTGTDMDILKVSLQTSDTDSWAWKVGILWHMRPLYKSAAVKTSKHFKLFYSTLLG